MPYFKVMIEGEGIKISSEKQEPSITGFFTTRLVRASTTEEAEKKAKTMILAEWTSAEYAKVNKGSLPSLTVSSMEKTNFIESLKSKYTGYSFYMHDDEQ